MFRYLMSRIDHWRRYRRASRLLDTMDAAADGMASVDTEEFDRRAAVLEQGAAELKQLAAEDVEIARELRGIMASRAEHLEWLECPRCTHHVLHIEEPAPWNGDRRHYRCESCRWQGRSLTPGRLARIAWSITGWREYGIWMPPQWLMLPLALIHNLIHREG